MTPNIIFTCWANESEILDSFHNELIDYLATKNIHTSVHFKPLYLYKPFREYNNREYPVADVEWKKLISLPCHNDMSSQDVEYVYYWVNKWMEEVYLEAK